MWHPATGTNLYLSGPDLPPWDEQNDWHYFERTEVHEQLKKVLLDSTAISQVFLIGPYKVGKTSTINYLVNELKNHKTVKIIIGPIGKIADTLVRWFEEYVQERTENRAQWLKLWQSAPMLHNDARARESWDSIRKQMPDPYQMLLVNLKDALMAAHQADTTLPRDDLMEHITECQKYFSRCVQAALDTTSSGDRVHKVLLLLLGERNYTGTLSDILGFNPPEALGNNSMVQVKILYEGSEKYEGRSEETAHTRDGSPGFEDRSSSSRIRGLAQVKKIEIHAFTCEEAEEFVNGKGVDTRLFDRVTFPNSDEILNQVGYHPALLQIVCWWMAYDKAPSGCWDRRLEEIREHVPKLIKEEEREKEKTAILHPERGVSPSVINRLKGKGVIL